MTWLFIIISHEHSRSACNSRKEIWFITNLNIIQILNFGFISEGSTARLMDSARITWIGWIPGLKIDLTFLRGRFIYFNKLYLIQWIMLILRISKFWSNSLGNRFLKISLNFWKSVGGTNMRGFLILKITQGVQLFTLINFIYRIRGIHLISCQPTQFQPT